MATSVSFGSVEGRGNVEMMMMMMMMDGEVVVVGG